MRQLLPRGADWLKTMDTESIGYEDKTFQSLGAELDRSAALGEFEQRDPLMRILSLLAGWAGRWESEDSPLFPRMVALWKPAQSMLRDLLFDLFPGEYRIIATLPGPRFVTIQNVLHESVVILFHRTSTYVAASCQFPGDTTNPVPRLIEELTPHLLKGWDAPEIRVFLAGEFEPQRRARIEATLIESGVSAARISTEFDGRETDALGSVHLALDRQTERVFPFHPGFDSVTFNLRDRRAQNASLSRRRASQEVAATSGSEHSPLRRAE